MRNVAFDIKSTPGFEGLSYHYFYCPCYISSFTVGCVDIMWYCAGIKPSEVMQPPFFHCILKDEALVRHIDLGCRSNSYQTLPHINPRRVNANCTKVYSINNPKCCQQDQNSFIGQNLCSGSIYLPFLIPVCTLEPAFRNISVHHTLSTSRLGLFLTTSLCLIWDRIL